MELINRTSKKLRLHDGRSITRLYATIGDGKIYFTSTATLVCELGIGLYVHFLNEGSDWNFIVNDDTDGFKLTQVKAKNGFHITNAGIVNLILSSTGHKSIKKFHIQKTSAMHDKCPVFSIKP